MYTPQEKQNAEKFVVGVSHLAGGIGAISGMVAARGHELRPELAAALQGTEDAFEKACLWFGGLLGKKPEARNHYDELLVSTQSLVNLVTPLGIKDSFQKALTAFTGFDWSLPYSDPHHANIPGVPMPLDKTVVGPHGDWDKSVAIIEYSAHGIRATMRDVSEIYRTVPVYTPDANHALKEQLVRFSKQVDLIARVWSMHIEVEHPTLDKPVIDGDLAASPPTRGRGFLRTLRQVELLFNNRTAPSKNFRGRGFAQSISMTLRNLYFQEIIVPLGRVNDHSWAYELVVGDGNGGLHGFTGRLGDWWQVLDAWAQSAFGFYHPLPSREEFTPVNPGDVVPTPSEEIPVGFFNPEVEKIEAARAEISQAADRVAAVINDLRMKETS